MSKHLYIDYSHLCYRVLYSVKSEFNGKIDNIEILRHVILKNLFHLIEKFNPTDVYVACDSKKNWRKKFYDGYKSGRKESRDKQDFDWHAFFTFITDLTQEIKNNFPFIVLDVPFLEADDIIAYLVRKNTDKDKVIVTSDGDYVQLLKYENTIMYDPIKRIIIQKKPHEADYALQIKILIGDKSDSVPACEPRLGIKTAEKLLDSGEIDEKMKIPLFKENFVRNTKLVDLTKTPRELIDRLEKQISEYKVSSSANIFNYFVEKGLRDLLSRTNEINNFLKIINSKEEKSTDSEILFG